MVEDRASLRERAAAVLAWYHDIEPAEAAELLLVLADYRGISVDDFAAEVLRSAAHRAAREEAPRSGDLSADGDRAAE